MGSFACFPSLLNSSVSSVLARCISLWFITVTEQCNKAFPCFTPVFSPLNYAFFHLLILFLVSSLWVTPGPDSQFFFCPLLAVPPWISFVSWPFSWFFHWIEIWGLALALGLVQAGFWLVEPWASKTWPAELTECTQGRDLSSKMLPCWLWPVWMMCWSF